MMNPVRCFINTALSVTVVLLSGCATTGDLPNALSAQDEKRLGAELAGQVEQQETVLNNAAIQSYVRSIGDRLARHAPRQDVTYEFTVIDAPDTVNAFALPGGHLYVYTGLMKLCQNEAQLASVMAHEIAHVAAHHHGESLTRQYGISLIAGVALGENPTATAQMVANIIGTAGVLKFSRDQEREADTIGMEVLFRSGYRPDSMINFMQLMRQKERESGQPQAPAFLSSHPATDARIEDLKVLLGAYPFELREQSPVYTERYRAEVLRKLD